MEHIAYKCANICSIYLYTYQTNIYTYIYIFVCMYMCCISSTSSVRKRIYCCCAICDKARTSSTYALQHPLPFLSLSTSLSLSLSYSFCIFLLLQILVNRRSTVPKGRLPFVLVAVCRKSARSQRNPPPLHPFPARVACCDACLGVWQR